MENAALFKLIILLITVIANSLLALFVFKNNPRSVTNRIFAILGFTISTWLITIYLSLQPYSNSISLFLIRLTIFLATPMSLLFFLLAHTLPKETLRLSKKSFLFLLLANLAVMGIAISPLSFTKLQIINNSPTPSVGIGLVFFGVFALTMSLAAVLILIKRIHESRGFEKQQFKLIMVGILLMYLLLIITVLLPVAIFQNNTFVSFAPLYTLIFLITTAYAIVKHHLLDIRLFVTRSVAYTLLIIILAFTYTASVFGVSTIFFSGKVSQNLQNIIYTSLALFIAFSFPPLKNFIEKTSDKIFFKNAYESNELLEKLTKVMAQTLDLNDLTKKTLHLLLTTLHISNGAFVVFEEKYNYPPISEGIDIFPNLDRQTMENLCAFKRIINFDEEKDKQIKDSLRNLNISILLPLYVGDKLHGLLFLGQKQSGDIYSDQDLQVLEIFGPEVSVAVQNSKAFEEIKKFNITLTQEVENATKNLRLANQKLQQLDDIKDDFVSIASHELRTPMTAIRSYVWMALHRSDILLSEKLKKYLYRTLISTERLINLVNDMLNISRIESGKIEILPKVFDMINLVGDIATEITPKAKERNLYLNVYKTQLPQVFADEDKTRQVLLNLIGNSLKFSPIDGRVDISFFTDGKFVFTSIKDNGVGILKDDLQRLFKKFGRLDNSYVAATTSGGTGLGLFISRELIELMGGEIKGYSEGINKGSTFTFSIPVPTPQVLENVEKYTKKVQGEAKSLETVAI